MATGPTRKPAQREAQRSLVVRGIAQGRTMTEMAEEFGIDRSQVSRDWAQAKAELQRQTSEEFRDWLAEKLLKLERAAELAMQCWLATMQQTVEQEWIGPAPLSEDDAEKLATLADADEELAKAMRQVGAGHWRPKKLNPAKPNPSFALAYAAITRLQFEAVGALQVRAKNEGAAAGGDLPGDLPRASEIKTAEDGRAALEMLDTMSGGRLLRYTAKRE